MADARRVEVPCSKHIAALAAKPALYELRLQWIGIERGDRYQWTRTWRASSFVERFTHNGIAGERIRSCQSKRNDAIGDGFMGGNGIIRDGELIMWKNYNVTNEYYPGSTKRSYALHQGKSNVVFCDGHVESPTLQFLFEDTSDALWSAGTATICHTTKNFRHKFRLLKLRSSARQ